MITLPDLPVRDILDVLDSALAAKRRAVVVAPPGAGKTTLLPLHLLQKNPDDGRQILLLEPRRLAARASARRMAALLGESPGQTIGYRMRMDQAVSDKTRILVVTEGIFARMVIDDPELSAISTVIFDEFHERSLDADFGLALALDVQEGLREDLNLIVMSATLDGARVAQLLHDTPVVESLGRSFPVDIRYQPKKPDDNIEKAMVAAIQNVLAEEEGSILAFLPGRREIEHTRTLLEGRVGAQVSIIPLYGALDAKAQDDAIRPTKQGLRKVVLATSIAESSLTIDGVRIVIDSGLSRVPVFEPASGLTRLETQRASRASVDQRAGRAGRTQAGIAIRLWHEGQTAALNLYSMPEILSADLSSLILDSAAFGVSDPTTLRFLDLPPKAALEEARCLLERLGALDTSGRITPAGIAMRQLSLPVRYAHMVAEAAARGEALTAARLAVLLSERGLGGMDIDVERRLTRFSMDKSVRAEAARNLARGIAVKAKNKMPSNINTVSVARFLLDAWPDRIAKARGEIGQFILANGRGAIMEPTEGLARAPFLVVAELSGKAGRTRILSAAEIDERTIRDNLASAIETRTEIIYDSGSASLRGRSHERLGAIVFHERSLPAPHGDAANLAWIDAVKTHGLEILPWGKESKNLRRRLYWLHKGLGEPWPQMADQALIQSVEAWLLPFLPGRADLKGLNDTFLTQALLSLVPYELQRRVNDLAPTHFIVPTGSKIPICYNGDEPVLAVRVQELFGLNSHPAIAGGTVKLVVELLSPAQRPIQITRDLPGFWHGSWKDVRADMRGRYPKHVWPEDPVTADPTRRAKARGT